MAHTGRHWAKAAAVAADRDEQRAATAAAITRAGSAEAAAAVAAAADADAGRQARDAGAAAAAAAATTADLTARLDRVTAEREAATAEAAAKEALFQRLLSLLAALRAESETADAETVALRAAAAARPSFPSSLSPSRSSSGGSPVAVGAQGGGAAADSRSRDAVPADAAAVAAAAAAAEAAAAAATTAGEQTARLVAVDRQLREAVKRCSGAGSFALPRAPGGPWPAPQAAASCLAGGNGATGVHGCATRVWAAATGVAQVWSASLLAPHRAAGGRARPARLLPRPSRFRPRLLVDAGWARPDRRRHAPLRTGSAGRVWGRVLASAGATTAASPVVVALALAEASPPCGADSLAMTTRAHV